MKKVFILLLIISCSLKISGQNSTLTQTIHIPQESIYLHQNTSFLLSGENEEEIREFFTDELLQFFSENEIHHIERSVLVGQHHF